MDSKLICRTLLKKLVMLNDDNPIKKMKRMTSVLEEPNSSNITEPREGKERHQLYQMLLIK